MRLVLLAAGSGERLLPLTRSTPPPLLELGNGRTLLETQVECAAASTVVLEVVLVTGYRSEQVDDAVRTLPQDRLPVRTLHNPFWEVSGSLLGLWLARSEMGRDVLVSHGDNLFTPDVLREMVEDAGEGISLALTRVASHEPYHTHARLVGGRVRQVGRDVDRSEADGVVVGLALVRGGRARAIAHHHLEQLARRRRQRQSTWLELVNALGRDDVPVQPWWLPDEQQWHEVDAHIDHRRLNRGLAWRSFACAGVAHGD